MVQILIQRPMSTRAGSGSSAPIVPRTRDDFRTADFGVLLRPKRIQHARQKLVGMTRQFEKTDQLRCSAEWARGIDPIAVKPDTLQIPDEIPIVDGLGPCIASPFSRDFGKDGMQMH